MVDVSVLNYPLSESVLFYIYESSAAYGPHIPAAKRKRDTQDQERVSLPSAHCALRTARVHPGSLMGET